MSDIEHILEYYIVFLEQVTHLIRGRMQEFAHIGKVNDGEAENFKDDVNALNFSKLVNRPFMHNMLHFHFR